MVPLLFALPVFLLSSSLNARAQEVTVAVDCAGEIKTFCSQVTPGADRIVACLIAYEDKISPRCQMTAYLASGTLANRTNELRNITKICGSDILQYCSKVPPGGGRIYDCLRKNKATLNDECRKIVPRFKATLGN